MTNTVVTVPDETKTVANLEDAYTGDIAISGATPNDIKVGNVLQVTSTLADEDGIPTSGTGALSYQWKADDAAITGATGTSYTITRDALGKEMSVTATYTDLDGRGTGYTINKSIAGKVQNINNTGTGAVLLSGTQPKEGETVTASTTTMDDADVLGPISFQWKSKAISDSSFTNITNQTSSSLVLTEELVDKVIIVVASYTDGQGFSESKTSANFGPVVNVNQAPQGSVSIVNNSTNASLTVAIEDQVIKIVQNLSDTDELGTLSYEWLANDVVVSGQAGTTLTLGQAQVGKVISARVKYTDGHGTNESVTSSNTTTVSNLNDNPEWNIGITGSPTVGTTLSLSNTTTDEDGIPTSGNNAFRYQWLADGVNINGASSNEYVLTSLMAGKKISALVSYVDNQGTAESKVTSPTLAIGMTVTRGTTPDVIGNLGEDNLTGTAGGDIFTVAKNDAAVSIDKILNYTVADDYLLVNLASFGFALATYGLTSGNNVAGKFTTATPTTTGATFVYLENTLYFDPDGSGSTSATPLVQLTGAPNLTAEKIFV